MSVVVTGNVTHDANVAKAEGVRQVAVANAANQAAIIAAEIAFYKTCLKSAIANGCGAEPFIVGLKQLGVQGLYS